MKQPETDIGDKVRNDSDGKQKGDDDNKRNTWEWTLAVVERSLSVIARISRGIGADDRVDSGEVVDGLPRARRYQCAVGLRLLHRQQPSCRTQHRGCSFHLLFVVVGFGSWTGTSLS